MDKPDRADQIADTFFASPIRSAELAAALRAYRNEALEEAAKRAESRPTGSSDDGMAVQRDIVATIRYMKTPEEGREGGKRA